MPEHYMTSSSSALAPAPSSTASNPPPNASSSSNAATTPPRELDNWSTLSNTTSVIRSLTMKICRNTSLWAGIALSLCMAVSVAIFPTGRIAWAGAPAATVPPEKSIAAPRDIKLSVKMIGPVTQTTDLQIICVLQHEAAGDKYLEAMIDFNEKMGGLLSALRDRGEFAGELGETLLFTPPPGSIAPKRVLLIGVGPESDLTLDRLRLVGAIAARESVRIGAPKVSFAPTLRDQGSSRIDVAEGDEAFVQSFLLAYDTERRLQEQGLAPSFQMTELVIEAGPKFFDAVVEKVGLAAQSSADTIEKRDARPYR